jgi:hypothetical protein
MPPLAVFVESSEERETLESCIMEGRKSLALPGLSVTTAPTENSAEQEMLRQRLLELILKSERNRRRLNLALLKTNTPAAEAYPSHPTGVTRS